MEGNANTGTVISPKVPYSYVGGIAGFTMTLENVDTTNVSTQGLHIGSDVDYDSGRGIEGDPFIITTAAQLDGLRTHLAAFYQLGSDIDLTAFLAGSPYGWLPIAGITPGVQPTWKGFFGGLDGTGHKITKMWGDYSNAPFSLESAGLFGRLSGEVRDLEVVLDAKGIKGGSNVGGIAGFLANGGSIIGCRVTGEGSIQATGTAGGIVGSSHYSTDSNNIIRDCYNGVDVISVNGNENYGTNVGGIAGSMDGTTVDGCTNDGNISANHGAGGIVGHAAGGTVSNNTNNGTVTGTITERGPHDDWAVGGIVGEASGILDIIGNTNNGKVSSTSDIPNTGAIIGRVEGGLLGYINEQNGYQNVTITDNTYREDTAYVGVGGNSPQYNTPEQVKPDPVPDPDLGPEPELGPDIIPGPNPGDTPSTGTPTGTDTTAIAASGSSLGIGASMAQTTPAASTPSAERDAQQSNSAQPQLATPESQGDTPTRAIEADITPLVAPLGLGFATVVNTLLTIFVGLAALIVIFGGGFGFWRLYRRRIR
jgi:hypothetical protein